MEVPDFNADQNILFPLHLYQFVTHNRTIRHSSSDIQVKQISHKIVTCEWRTEQRVVVTHWPTLESHLYSTEIF